MIAGAGPKARQRQKPRGVTGSAPPGNFEHQVLRNAKKKSYSKSTLNNSNQHGRPLEMNASFFKQRLPSTQA